MDNYPMGVNGSSDYFDQPDAAEVIDPAHDAEVVRRMALAQALYKAVSAEVKTGDEFNLRGEFDAIMRERYRQAKAIGAPPKTIDVEVDGEKVGSYSFTVGKARPASTRADIVVEDRDALLGWALTMGYFDVDMDAVRGHFARTGEVPDGCRPVEVVEPARPGGEVERTSLRIDPAKVASALGGALDEAVSALLEGGE